MRRKNQIEVLVDQDLIDRFKNRIISIDLTIMIQCGKLFGEDEKKGIKIPSIDGIIASTAMVHELFLVTRNTRDFLSCKVPIENPWET